MSEQPPTKSIRVHILGREYALRVREEDETHTRRMAAFVNARMEKFKDAHPEQAELTTAVITALALAEELHIAREKHDHDAESVSRAMDRLAGHLSAAVDRAPDDADAEPDEAAAPAPHAGDGRATDGQVTDGRPEGEAGSASSNL